MADGKKVRWIDLSKYGMFLRVVQLADKRRFLVMVGGDKYPDQMKALGFYRLPSGQWARENLAFSLKDFRTGPNGAPAGMVFFPEAGEALLDNVVHRVGVPSQGDPNRISENRPDVALSQMRALGFNNLGQEVLESVDGLRFIRTGKSGVLREAEMAAASPALFLRAPDAHALSACADGFVKEVLAGRILRRDDLRRFATAVFSARAGERVDIAALTDDDPRLRAAQGAISDAIGRRIARSNVGVSRDVFGEALRLHEGYLIHDNVGIGGTSVPMAVVLQRLLGNVTELNGADVVAVNIGNGTLAATLPGTARVKAFVRSPRGVERASRLLRHAGIEHLQIDGGLDRAVRTETTYQVGVLPCATMAEPYVNEAGEWRRTDIAGLFEALPFRKDEGRSVFTLAGGDGPEVRDALAWIARHYVVEGASLVDDSLHSDQVTGALLPTVVIGSRRPEPLEQAPEVPVWQELRDFNALWTWSSEVISERRRALAADSELGDGDMMNEDAAGRDREEENSFQAPTPTAVEGGETTTMVPRYQEAAYRLALGRLVEKVGDTRKFVAKELGWSDEEIGDGRLSPEQIDAVALAIDADRRGRAFLEADFTGTGKGRVLAALALYALRSGRTPVFVTDGPNLLSDFWRDVRAIKAEHVFKPLVLNNGVRVVNNITGEEYLRAPSAAQLRQIIESGEIPIDTNLVLTTYSRFNKDPEKKFGAAARWLRKVVGGEVFLLCDESHVASGDDSNTGFNIQYATERAGGLVFSSATWAKHIKNMRVYRRVFPDTVDTGEEFLAILRKGGEVLQEVISTMLVEDGVMVHREHDLSRAHYLTLTDEAHADRNRAYMRQVAPIFAEMARLSGEISQYVGRVNEANKDLLERLGPNERGRNRLHLAGVGNFGAQLQRLQRLFYLGLKLDFLVDNVIDDLENDRKPFILLEQTLGQVMREMKDAADDAAVEAAEGGDADFDDEVEGTPMPDFRDLLQRQLDRLMKVSRQRGGRRDDMVDYRELNPETRATYDAISRQIEVLPDLPVSAIDYIITKLSERGYVVGEISGRTLKWAEGRIVKREKEDRNAVVGGYNRGDVDVLVATTAGCTGLSAHASPTFPDQRPRVMHKVEAPADIAEETQGDGRINRFDQVNEPTIISYDSGLPAEKRQIMLRDRRKRRLSANVTANREDSTLNNDVPDLLNAVGNEVCRRYLEAHPNIMRKLCLDEVKRDGESEAEQRKGQSEQYFYANKFLSRLMLLDPEEQEQIWTELVAEYNAVIEELEARNQNPLRSKELAGRFKIVDRVLFEGSDQIRIKSKFDEPVYLAKLQGEVFVRPARSEDVGAMIDIGFQEMGAETCQVAAERLARRRPMLLERLLPPEYASVQAALEAGAPQMVLAAERIDRLIAVLNQLQPGCELSFTIDEEVVTGLVTHVELPRRGEEHLAGQYLVRYIVPGAEVSQRMPLYTLLNDDAFAVRPGLHEDFDGAMAPFDAARVGTRRIRKDVLLGNLWSATDIGLRHKLGQPVFFEDDAGVRHRAFLISAKMARGVMLLPVRVPMVEIVREALLEARVLRNNPKLDSRGGISVYHNAKKELRLSMPSPHGAAGQAFYQDPRVAALINPEQVRRGRPEIVLTPDNVDHVARTLWEGGVRFYLPGNDREWVRERMVALNPDREVELEAAEGIRLGDDAAPEPLAP